MAYILIADPPETAATLRHILEGHELVFVNTLSESEITLAQSAFDLVIATLHFDSSRMFDFFRQVRNSRLNGKKPIICFCSRDTVMTRRMHENLECSLAALGAWMYLDEHMYNTFKNPDAELRRVIDRCLCEQDRREILQRRFAIQEERSEIHTRRKRLETVELTPELKEQLAGLRIDLELLQQQVKELHSSADSHRSKVRYSRNEQDRVSEEVSTRENDMTELEEAQSFRESMQVLKENEISEKEDLRQAGQQKQTADLSAFAGTEERRITQF